MDNKIDNKKPVDWRELRDPNTDKACRESDLLAVDAPSIETPLADGANTRPASSEMRGGPGFRVNTNFDRVSAEQIQRLSEFETPEISDALTECSPWIRQSAML